MNTNKEILEKKQKSIPVSFSIKPATHEKIKQFKIDFDISSMSGIIEELILNFMKETRDD